MKGLRLSPAVAAVVAALFVLAGCTTEAGVENDSGGFADQVAASIDQAVAGDASEPQLAILRHAQAGGELSLEDSRMGARAAVECMTEAGLSAIYSASTTEWGSVLPEYAVAWTMGDDTTDALIQACDEREDLWVNQLFQTQPSSMALKDAVIERKDPLVRSCLERNGYAPDPDASPAEVIAQAITVDSNAQGAIDCIAEAGIW